MNRKMNLFNYCVAFSCFIDRTTTVAVPEWELILDHKDVENGYFSSNLLTSGLENENDPTANTYSIIGLWNNDSTLQDD